VANTQFGDKILRYPEDMIDQSTDYFQIEVLKQKKTSGGFNAISGIQETFAGPFADPNKAIKKSGGIKGLYKGDIGTGSAATAADKYGDLPTSHVMILPIPQNIKDNNGVTWGESKLNDFAAFGLSRIGEAMNAETGMDLLKTIPETFAGAGTKEAAARGTQVLNYGKIVAAAAAANALGANVTVGGLLSRASGQIINQNLEMVFSGVKVRSFNFAWDLVPRSKSESIMVEKIIKVLKMTSAAKMDKDNLGFLNAPDVYRIKYMKGGKPHPFLNRFKTCALQNIAMNYTGSGTYATYREGTPVHMKIDLSFTELNPIYAEDQKEITSGVGY
tara:strand:+ start:731 stop:1723 length:993 start_codon:yes stop_codon:yes gene_type:complete